MQWQRAKINHRFQLTLALFGTDASASAVSGNKSSLAINFYILKNKEKLYDKNR